MSEVQESQEYVVDLGWGGPTDVIELVRDRHGIHLRRVLLSSEGNLTSIYRIPIVSPTDLKYALEKLS